MFSLLNIHIGIIARCQIKSKPRWRSKLKKSISVLAVFAIKHSLPECVTSELSYSSDKLVKMSRTETDLPVKVQSTIEIDFWTGMKLLGVMRTGKQIRTHLLTGGLLLAFGIVLTIISPFEPILVFSLPVFGIILIIFCIYCVVARDIRFNFIVSICTSLVSMK